MVFGSFLDTLKRIKWRYDDDHHYYEGETINYYRLEVEFYRPKYGFILRTEKLILEWKRKGELIEEAHRNGTFDRKITYFKRNKLVEINGLCFIYNLRKYLNNRPSRELSNELANLSS